MKNRNQRISLRAKEIVKSITENDKVKKEKYKPINTSDVFNGMFYDTAFIDFNNLKGQFKKKFKKGDILFSEIRPIQKHYTYIDFDSVDDYIVSTKLMVLRNYNNNVDTKYFYYWLTSEETLTKLQKMAENRIASFPQITFDENVADLIVQLPSFEQQNKISNLVSMIDNLIRINNDINDNLFKQLNTIYNYWFIQYEFPNENGKPYKSNGGSLKFSNELNTEIPIGFYVQNIINNDISQVIKPGIDVFSNNKIYYATADVDKINIKNGSLITYNNRETRANMQPVVFSVWFAKMKNSIKHLFLNENMIDFINNSILSTGFLGIQCDKISFEYMSSFIEFSSFESKKDMISHGATQQAVNNDDLLNVKLLIPTSDVLNNYHKLAKPLYETISNNICENNRLIKLRNFLLPLLINGQATIS